MLRYELRYHSITEADRQTAPAEAIPFKGVILTKYVVNAIGVCRHRRTSLNDVSECLKQVVIQFDVYMRLYTKIEKK